MIYVPKRPLKFTMLTSEYIYKLADAQTQKRVQPPHLSTKNKNWLSWLEATIKNKT